MTTTADQRSLSGREVQRILGLRSSWFTLGVLSLARPAKPLVYAVESELTGTVRGLGGVRLERRKAKRWRLVGPVAPDADGTFAVAVKPTRSAFYRLAIPKAVGAQVRVLVAPFVRLDPDTAGGGLSGSAKPVYAGTPVSIQRYIGTTWSEVARAALDAKGRFSAQLDLVAGTYRARVAPGHGLVAGTSRVLRVLAG